jgi:hypothetical protein
MLMLMLNYAGTSSAAVMHPHYVVPHAELCAHKLRRVNRLRPHNTNAVGRQQNTEGTLSPHAARIYTCRI